MPISSLTFHVQGHDGGLRRRSLVVLGLTRHSGVQVRPGHSRQGEVGGDDAVFRPYGCRQGPAVAIPGHFGRRFSCESKREE